MRPRTGKKKILPASATDLRTLVEDYRYPLLVCEEGEGKILFYNSATNLALDEENLLGRPLPKTWIDAEETESVALEIPELGEVPCRFLWEEILWNGNPAWYMVAIPVFEGVVADEGLDKEARELKAKLEESQELAAVQVEELRTELLQSKEIAAESESLREQLEEAQKLAAEAELLREKLVVAEKAALEHRGASEEHLVTVAALAQLRQDLSRSEDAAVEVSELKEKIQRLEEQAQEAEELRTRLEQSVEMVAVESEKRVVAEEEREKLEAKLRDLHQRSLNKLESARKALESERLERKELSERLTQLKEETDSLRAQLDVPDEVSSQEGSNSNTDSQKLETLELELSEKKEQFRHKCEELRDAEEKAERYQAIVESGSQEFSGDSEVGELREKVTSLEKKLAVAVATTTGASALALGQSASDQSDSEREARIQELQHELNSREQQIMKLERRVSSGETENNGVVSSDSESLVAELRFHRKLEFQELQTAFRNLQDRVASGKAFPGSEVLASSDVASENLQLLVDRLQAELQVQQGLASESLGLRDQVKVLESDLRDALLLANANSQESGSEDQEARLRQLEEELTRARQEASPEELLVARNRIAELEAELAGLSQEGSLSTELHSQNQQLELLLRQTQEQLSERSHELKRVVEGDRETKKLAYADQLTGLPNLNLTGQYLQVCFERSGRGEGALALILIDLDHFRRVNDTLGQRSGDELLKQVGARLQRSVTEKDTAIARRGEDEFMVVAFMEKSRVDGEALMARVRGIAHKLLKELSQPFEVQGHNVQVTASLGVALYPGPAQSPTELLEQTESAMYKSKDTGRARVSFYTAEVHKEREHKRQLEMQLKDGLRNQQFGLAYQPIYDLATSKVVGVEALLRWAHPSRGLMEASEFLKIAEETGLIVQIGDQVIQEALQVASQKFMKRRFLSINLSFRQLVDAGFAARFMKYLQLAGVPPHEVIVEISESALRIDPERVKNTLEHLNHWGVGVALDDFGIGRSDLSTLVDMSLRVLKIDGSIVKKLPDDQAASKLCHAITKLSSTLGVPVLAEGVETREQLKQVANFGCQYAQGVMLQEPLSVNQLVQVL